MVDEKCRNKKELQHPTLARRIRTVQSTKGFLHSDEKYDPGFDSTGTPLKFMGFFCKIIDSIIKAESMDI